MRKIKSNGGLSLLEMLMTTLILSFTMVTLVNGSVSIKRLYSDALRKADAQMLLSQVETTLRNDLSFAREYTVSGGVLTGYSKYSVQYSLSKENWENEEKRGFQTRFISSGNKSRLEGLSLDKETFKVKYDDATDCFTVSGLQVIYQNETILSGDDFIIRALSDVQSGN